MDLRSSDKSADGVVLPHLTGPGAELRQVMAAHFLRDCEHVLEIGGAGLPIARFLTHRPKSVTVIDPKIEAFRADSLNGAPCRVEYIARKLQAVDIHPEPGTFGLILLGLSLKPFGSSGAIDPRLLDWVDQAQIVIIEYPAARDRSSEQFPLLTDRGTLDQILHVRLQIEDSGFRQAGFSERYFFVYRPKRSS